MDVFLRGESELIMRSSGKSSMDSRSMGLRVMVKIPSFMGVNSMLWDKFDPFLMRMGFVSTGI